jgi:hypothetical protein
MATLAAKVVTVGLAIAPSQAVMLPLHRLEPGARRIGVTIARDARRLALAGRDPSAIIAHIPSVQLFMIVLHVFIYEGRTFAMIGWVDLKKSGETNIYQILGGGGLLPVHLEDDMLYATSMMVAIDRAVALTAMLSVKGIRTRVEPLQSSLNEKRVRRGLLPFRETRTVFINILIST